MADSAPGVASGFNTKVIEEFRANGGRAGLWPKLVAEYPSIGEFQARTTRQIPAFMPSGSPPWERWRPTCPTRSPGRRASCSSAPMPRWSRRGTN